MKIHVDKVDKETVYFTTEYGFGKGIWKVANPILMQDYFVEFDIEKKYCFEDMHIETNGQYQIKLCDNVISFTVLFEAYEENGCATVRIGNSIFEVETDADERFPALLDSYVTLHAEELFIYDEGVTNV